MNVEDLLNPPTSLLDLEAKILIWRAIKGRSALGVAQRYGIRRLEAHRLVKWASTPIEVKLYPYPPQCPQTAWAFSPSATWRSECVILPWRVEGCPTREDVILFFDGLGYQDVMFLFQDA